MYRRKQELTRAMHRQAGFTLVELLVVIAIIGLLVGLLLPAVQAAREAARRMQCQNNIKQIGLALHNYESAHRKFPPFFIHRRGNPSRIADLDKGANWLTMLLPYMEQSPLHQAWDFSIPVSQNEGRSTRISAFQCPSDAYSFDGPCSYAGGEWARGNYGLNVSPCKHGVSDGGGVGAANFSVSLRDITDGTSNTIAIDERRAGLNEHDLRGCWAMPGLGSGTAAMFNDGSAPNSTGPRADDMENCTVSGSFETPPMGCFDVPATGQMTARSMHSQGVHVGFADGSVHFIGNEIDATSELDGCGPIDTRGVWQRLHTRGAGEIVGELSF